MLGPTLRGMDLSSARAAPVAPVPMPAAVGLVPSAGTVGRPVPFAPPRGPRPPKRLVVGHGWRRVNGTVVAVTVAAFSASAAISFAALRYAPTSPAQGFVVLAWLVGMALAGALVWRARYPVAICIAASVSALLLPLDTFAALLALTWVIARSSTRTAWACGALTGVATGVALLRDALRDGEAVLFSLTDAETGATSYLLPVGYVLVGVLFVATAVATGLVRRYRGTATRAQAEVQVQAQVAQELRTELTRQDERDLIAREMHDTVAHHLSLVSLQAASLEVTSADPDVDVPQAARAMRSSAHQALEEMRALISTLRDSAARLGAEAYAGPAPTLADLPVLVASAREAGADVTASVFVTDGATAPPALTRAVYRMVQESLTNAVKHAPGARVEIEVRAAPGAGVLVRARNPMVPVAPRDTPPAGSGAGLVGMRERAESLGGTFEAGVLEGWFLVQAHLPWRASGSG